MIELSNSRTELKLPSRRYTVMSRKKRSTLFIHELDCGVTRQSDWMAAYYPEPTVATGSNRPKADLYAPTMLAFR